MINPIITSLLDTDIYKLHMQQAVWHQYPQSNVTLEFVCRNNEDLLPYLSQIQYQIELLKTLKLTDDEHQYLSELGFYKADYLDYLSGYVFDPNQVAIFVKNNELKIEIRGLWHQVILWEVPILAIVSEVSNKQKHPNIGFQCAEKRLASKLAFLKESKVNKLNMIDFGTRRRFSKVVHENVIKTLIDQIPNHFIGTSNLYFAKKFNISPIGTQAHEWFQAHQRLVDDLPRFQNLALHAWLKEYPKQLGIALTDCISMDCFLRDFDFDLAQTYQGLRQDSGDPIKWGKKALQHYFDLGINYKDKTFVFSDALTIPKAIEIHDYFKDKINTCFGIGTNLTCDIPSVTPMNIVIKMTECNDLTVAKISDSPGKLICRDFEYIQKLENIFCLN